MKHILFVALLLSSLPAAGLAAGDLFDKSNLAALWIVPYDAKKRGPEERAQMLQELGLTKLAYDWRTEHVPTFNAEIEAMQKHGIEINRGGIQHRTRRSSMPSRAMASIRNSGFAAHAPSR